MRDQLRFSKFGKILQEKVLKPGETAEFFRLEIPKNYVGFLYYLANNHYPLNLNIDGDKMDIRGIFAPINSPKLFNPPFLVKDFIAVTGSNTTKEDKKVSFYADGVAYSVLTISEEVMINEIKEKLTVLPPVKTEEARPRKPHIINHKLTTSNQWYEIKLPVDGVKAWSLRCRESNDINYKFDSGSTYMTLASGETLSEDTAPKDINSIFVRSATADVTLEMELWRKT